MNKAIDPWMMSAFELLKHAEDHRLAGKTFDRKMALISYDNAIEVSIHSFVNQNESDDLQ